MQPANGRMFEKKDSEERVKKRGKRENEKLKKERIDWVNDLKEERESGRKRTIN